MGHMNKWDLGPQNTVFWLERIFPKEGRNQIRSTVLWEMSYKNNHFYERLLWRTVRNVLIMTRVQRKKRNSKKKCDVTGVMKWYTVTSDMSKFMRGFVWEQTRTDTYGALGRQDIGGFTWATQCNYTVCMKTPRWILREDSLGGGMIGSKWQFALFRERLWRLVWLWGYACLMKRSACPSGKRMSG